MPTTGVGRIGPSGTRCRARRCRRRPVSSAPRTPRSSPSIASRQLPCDVRLLRVAEVQAVRQPERVRADAGEVRCALIDRLGGARARVARDAAPVAVDRDRDRTDAGGRALQHQHRGIRLLGTPHRARLDDRVVLLEHGRPRGDVGARDQREQRSLRPAWRRRERRLDRAVEGTLRRTRRQVVDGAVVDEHADRQVADDIGALQDPETDVRSVTTPIGVASVSQC